MLCIAAVYEIEALCWRKWHIDIPGIVTRIIALSKTDDNPPNLTPPTGPVTA